MKIFNTKEGVLSFAFLVIILAFCLIILALRINNDMLIKVSFAFIVVAMLLSPIKVYILDKLIKKEV